MAKFKTGTRILYKGQPAIIEKKTNLVTVNPKLYSKGTVGYEIVTVDGRHHICVKDDEKYMQLV